MGSPFLQIKFSVLAAAEQHKEQLLQQCIKSSEMSVLHGLRSMAPSMVAQAATSEDARVRLLAVELAANCLTHEQAMRLLQQLAEDSDDAVREEACWHLESLRDSVYRV
jgi:hypothetical protein